MNPSLQNWPAADSTRPQKQLFDENDEQEHLRDLLLVKKKRYDELELTQGRLGYSTQPETITEMRDLKREMEDIGRKIRPPVTTESPELRKQITLPPFDASMTKGSPELGGEQLSEWISATMSKSSKAKKSIPVLEDYLERYQETIDPVRCCVIMKMNIDKLRQIIDDLGSSNKEFSQVLFTSKEKELRDLLDEPCIARLRESCEPEPSQRNLISPNMLTQYENTCDQARDNVEQIMRLNVLNDEDVEQIRQILRKLRAAALVIHEAWMQLHNSLYGEIKGTLSYIEQVLGD